MRKKAGILRGSLYIIGLIVMLSIPLSYIEDRSFCIIYNLTNTKCIGCGTTRAAFNLINLNIYKALEYNFVSSILFIIIIIIFLLDIIKVIRLMFARDYNNISYSIVERCFILINKYLKKAYNYD